MNEKKYSFVNIKAIIGLGNPGSKYLKTRHNIGFRVADQFIARYSGSWSSRDLMEHCQINISDTSRNIHVIKPTTFMNNSGQVIPFLLKKGISGDDILVIHDELEKSFGKTAIRWNGSARGHNGLRSICDFIGKDFWRLQFGIGRPEQKEDVGRYVLSPFFREEEDDLLLLIEKAISLIEGK
jgi:PTH1 family peptidyl-tRNA hydrolase